MFFGNEIRIILIFGIMVEGSVVNRGHPVGGRADDRRGCTVRLTCVTGVCVTVKKTLFFQSLLLSLALVADNINGDDSDIIPDIPNYTISREQHLPMATHTLDIPNVFIGIVIR